MTESEFTDVYGDPYTSEEPTPMTTNDVAHDNMNGPDRSWQQVVDQLRAPFADIKWRMQRATNKKDQWGQYPPNTRGLFMAYIDARQLYDRLDDVIGFGNWSRRIVAVNADGSVTGRLSFRIADEWISQEDIGYPNNPGSTYETEPLKAAASDAYKRAGVGFGIGRYLYDLPAEWHPIDEHGNRIDGNTGELFTPANPAPHQAQQPTGRDRYMSQPDAPYTTPQRQQAPGGPSEKQLGWITSLEKDIDEGELAYIYELNGIDRMNLTGGRGGTASKAIDILNARKRAMTNPEPPTF